ncbi:cell wall synthase accessory phosphoprotein MacP [Pseudolactococcus insecticola]|uniref:Uncharacterized protein n=1 Tax=Pseudolactococcus insecticola TaxID=2709158 RepID=A0A6A0B9G2_9LACT|nr:cell wall synthase accessory phosphoprotein MacP [Lactococcus insecticola]GFH40974.1 hypothetical protein Hs20B_13720 [Lactococcus insecticola]
MPKPLLTDDIINQASREKQRLDDEIARAKSSDPELAKKFAAQKAQIEKNQIYKSRRIEAQKRDERGKKMTKYIVILAILLIIVMIVVFKF